MTALLEWAQLATLLLIPGVWWAARLSIQMGQVAKSLPALERRVQQHETKIAVLEAQRQ